MVIAGIFLQKVIEDSVAHAQGKLIKSKRYWKENQDGKRTKGKNIS